MSDNNGKKGGLFGCCGCFGGCGAIILGLVALVVLLVCGGLYYLTSNSPKPLFNNFTPDAASANAFSTAVKQAGTQVGSGGQFQLTFTEQQVSSWLNLELEKNSNGDNALKNLQVKFENNSVQFYGEIDTVRTIGMLADITLTVNEAGKVETIVNKAEFGAIELPESSRQDLSDSIERTIDEELFKINPNYRVVNLSAVNGTLNVGGTSGN